MYFGAGCLKGEGLMNDLLKKIVEWNEENEYQKCVDAIETIPEEERGYELTVLLGRAYSNLGVLGDNNSKANEDGVDIFLLEKAVNIFESVRLQGLDDWYWNCRMAYALWMTAGRELEALAYARKWQQLKPDDEDAANLIKTIEEYIEENYREPEVYSFEEMQSVGAHIEKYFGKYGRVMHELASPDIHVDIYVIPPRAEHEYYTLVTCGMGAHKMEVPDELKNEQLERAELLINLPAGWQLDEESLKDEKWYWPIRFLKFMARSPVNNGMYYDWGSTLEFDDITSFDDSTKLCSAVVLSPGVFGEASYACTLPNGDAVNFYQAIPLYKEELDYKVENGMDKLLQKCPDEILEVINPSRLNAVTDAEILNYDDREMDCAAEHLKLIQEHNLSVDELAVYNHMAAYLRWCINHNLMGDVFLQQHGDVAINVKSDSHKDLRAFVRDELGGRLMIIDYNYKGVGFANWYNTGNRSMPYAYLKDLKAYAAEYFKEQPSCDEDTAYLLLPWGEEYYKAVEEIINARFEEFMDLGDADENANAQSFDETQFKELLPDWQGARHCLASGRIIMDGCEVGFCCREEPDSDDTGWDSGWRFEAGDEDEVYSDDENHYKVYDLNTLCNLCPEILKILNSPFDTAFERGADGKLHKINMEDEG